MGGGLEYEREFSKPCSGGEGVRQQSEVNSKQEIPALLRRLEEETRFVIAKSVL